MDTSPICMEICTGARGQSRRKLFRQIVGNFSDSGKITTFFIVLGEIWQKNIMKILKKNCRKMSKFPTICRKEWLFLRTGESDEQIGGIKNLKNLGRHKQTAPNRNVISIEKILALIFHGFFYYKTKLTWEMATKSSVSIGSKPSCLIARWNDPTEMQAICFGRTFIFVRKRSTRLIALKRTSLGRSYHTLRQRNTWAAPSRVPIVISPSYKKK